MVKVNSDPAQVIVNHASFRVQLAPVQKPRFADTARVPVMSGAAPGGRRRTPVVWSGKSSPGDPGATGLLQAVRDSAAVDTLDRPATGPSLDVEAGITQVIPRVGFADDTMPTPVVGAPRRPEAPLLPPMRRAEGAYDARPHENADGYAPDSRYDDEDGADGYAEGSAAHQRHAYYPGRRMNLGVVLLPLRVFLGFISIYAGMGKLCDPVYFDGGERGSMVKWLTSLDPWPLAEPLRDFALSHPVGAGLTVAFAQVVVGVLTVLGLWQRVAAVLGTLLSAALLLTVSWRAVPVYDAPDIIYLAAWSPLIIAGAPVYSIDGRLAGEAWRTLGPRSALWALRRRVLRRGVVVAAVVVGLTLLVGSVLGGAVRSSDLITVPGPNDDPTNHLPGRPLPEEPTESEATSESPREPTPSASSSASASPSESAGPTAGTGDQTETVRESGRIEEQRPTATQGVGDGAPQQPRPEPPPSSSVGPSSSGGGGGGGGGGDDSGSGDSDDGDSDRGNRNPLGGLLG